MDDELLPYARAAEIAVACREANAAGGVVWRHAGVCSALTLLPDRARPEPAWAPSYVTRPLEAAELPRIARGRAALRLPQELLVPDEMTAPTGLVPRKSIRLMAARWSDLVPPVDISAVISEDTDFADYARVDAAAFDGSEDDALAVLPAVVAGGRRLVHATLAGRVVAVAASTRVELDDVTVTGVYGVAVLPDWRRRGLGAAVTWAALMRSPADLAYLHPSDMAVSVYAGLGFRELTGSTVWVAPDEM